MVYFALTEHGFAEAVATAKGEQPVWCAASAASQEQIAAMHATNITRFMYSADELLGSPSRIAGALATIAQHHPNEPIWIEHVAAA